MNKIKLRCTKICRVCIDLKKKVNLFKKMSKTTPILNFLAKNVQINVLFLGKIKTIGKLATVKYLTNSTSAFTLTWTNWNTIKLEENIVSKWNFWTICLMSNFRYFSSQLLQEAQVFIHLFILPNFRCLSPQFPQEAPVPPASDIYAEVSHKKWGGGGILEIGSTPKITFGS